MADCHPSNANKPAYCCDGPRPPPYCSQTDTTTRPVPTTTRPVPTTARPVPTTTRPATSTARPVPTTARPATSTARPVPTSARPATTTSSHTSLNTQELTYFQTSGAYNATVSVTELTDRYMIMASGEPDHAWGNVNPNRPSDQNYNFPIPKTPTTETIPGCLPLGVIGIARTGVPLFNPLDATNENAVEGPGAERLDDCDGHPDNRGAYHYHKLPFNCLYEGNVDEFMGVAMDGYAIYGPKVMENGVVKNLTSADLDKCHGRIASDGRYRYHMTFTFPYILGCFRGSVLYDRTPTQPICSSDTSVWDTLFGHYLCNCSTNNNNNNNMADCHPSNANKPAYCCDGPRPPPYCSQTDTTTGPTQTCDPDCETGGAQNWHQHTLHLVLLAACGYRLLQCLFQTLYTT